MVSLSRTIIEQYIFSGDHCGPSTEEIIIPKCHKVLEK
jgi:hypothetical protein